MNGPECPCRPAPVSTDLQAKRDAFIGRYGDDAGAWDAIHWDIASTHPDGATSAYIHFKKLSGKGKPPYPGGCLAGVLDFDGMVKEASYRLFGRSTLDGHTLDHAIRPRFDAVPASDRIDEKVFAEFRFECYRRGYCLHCPTLIEHARRDGDEGKEGEHILRSLLALFDRAGEPLPLSLREWSANSRFEQPPKGARRRPPKNWLRNRFIIHTVATLSYLTGRKPTRNEATDDRMACCDAVARAFQNNREQDLEPRTVEDLWSRTKSDDIALGPAMLQRWQEQDRREILAMPAQEQARQLERAKRRWIRLQYWREQDGWAGS